MLRNSCCKRSRVFSYKLLASTPPTWTWFCDPGAVILEASPLLACSLALPTGGTKGRLEGFLVASAALPRLDSSSLFQQQLWVLVGRFSSTHRIISIVSPQISTLSMLNPLLRDFGFWLHIALLLSF